MTEDVYPSSNDISDHQAIMQEYSAVRISEVNVRMRTHPLYYHGKTLVTYYITDDVVLLEADMRW